eukprot:TRINITY_DN987_c0_g1_i2.p1 TRINITY_DN987_c0_g1~~TRINITY_DN987_c0_g1_i2.p1  ORF type:complete len:176 (-),score=20.71 TRINITY_DN987_c0_g1_i2:674-1135(-)
MSRISTLFVVLACLVGMIATIVGQTTFTPCEASANYPFTLTNLNVNPDPVVIGQNVTVSVTGNLVGITLSGGYSSLLVSWCNPTCTPLPEFVFTNCDVTSCPITPGTHTFSHSIPVPSFALVGPYQGTLQVNNTDDSVVTCVNFQTSLVKPSA